jgi:molecular chaperone GrpE
MEKDKEQNGPPQEEINAETAAASAVPADEAEATSTESVVDKLKAEKAELYDRLLRKQAEMDNFRKRTHREKEEFRQYASEDLIRSLLPVLDGFERALKHRDAAVAATFYEGMEMIYRQLLDVLTRAGLEPVEAAGKTFNPHFHQAVETVEDDKRRDHEIIDELQRGYCLRQRLLRPAIVRVVINSKGSSTQSTGETADTD